MMRVAAERIGALFRAQRWLSLGRPRRKGGPPREPRILAVVRQGPNRLILEALSQDAGLAIIFSESCAFAHSDPAPVVIYDCELSPIQWPKIIRGLAQQSPRPYLILLSSQADANLWEELQRVGGSDVLRRPIDRDDFLAALTRAWQLRRSLERVRPPDLGSGDDPFANGVED